MTNSMTTRNIYGIYHANGGISGELRYFLEKLSKNSHCYLCDITHNFFREKRQWKLLTRRLQVKIKLLHLNEQSKSMYEFTVDQTPCIIERVEDGYRMLINRSQLKECNGEVLMFEEILRATI